MDLQEFVANFAAEFEDTPAEEITATTEFRELDEWSSIMGFYIISMVGDNYDVTLTNAEMKACKTVADIYNLVAQKA